MAGFRWGKTMADRVLIPLPDGRWLAFTPDELAEATARANELLLAVGLAPDPAPTPSTAEKWLTVSRTSDLMNLPRSYLYEGLKSSTVPGRKFGRFWRIPESYTHQNELVIRGSPAVRK